MYPKMNSLTEELGKFWQLKYVDYFAISVFHILPFFLMYPESEIRCSPLLFYLSLTHFFKDEYLHQKFSFFNQFSAEAHPSATSPLKRSSPSLFFISYDESGYDISS